MEDLLDRTAVVSTDVGGLWEATYLPVDPRSTADENYHDAAANGYDQWEQIPWMSHAEAWLVPWMVSNAGTGYIADFGTGTGRIADALRRAGSRNIIAIDRSRPMLEQALAKTGHNHILALRADVSKVPIRTATVDAVTCSGVLHHTVDPSQVIDEAARILRPGGRLVIREPNAEYPAHWFAPAEKTANYVIQLTKRSQPAQACEPVNKPGTENAIANDHDVSVALLRSWFGNAFTPLEIRSAKFLASVSWPVGMWGENKYYRVANRLDRHCASRLASVYGSLVLAVAVRR